MTRASGRLRGAPATEDEIAFLDAWGDFIAAKEGLQRAGLSAWFSLEPVGNDQWHMEWFTVADGDQSGTEYGLIEGIEHIASRLPNPDQTDHPHTFVPSDWTFAAGSFSNRMSSIAYARIDDTDVLFALGGNPARMTAIVAPGGEFWAPGGTTWQIRSGVPRFPAAMAANSTTIYVVDNDDAKAFDIADKAADPDKDITLASRPDDIVVGDTHLWAITSPGRSGTSQTFEAWSLSTQARDSDADVTITGFGALSGWPFGPMARDSSGRWLAIRGLGADLDQRVIYAWPADGGEPIGEIARLGRVQYLGLGIFGDLAYAYAAGRPEYEGVGAWSLTTGERVW